MGNKKNYRSFTAQEKYEIIKEGEYGSMSINEVCRRHRISTALYYQWRKQSQQAILDNFNSSKSRRNKKSQKEIDLETENARLKATLLEITQENVELKKKSFN